MGAPDNRVVLVVDDDQDNREALTEFLCEEGYEAIGVEDGLMALERLRTEASPALVLLDLRMPRLSGWDFLRERARDPRLASVPVVVLSADERRGPDPVALGATAMLSKPFELGRLLGVVEQYASNRAP